MSVSDKTKKNCDRPEVDEAIEYALSYGTKSPRELKEAVLKATGICPRVYYSHLKKLRETKIIQENFEKNSVGHSIKKYTLTDTSSTNAILPVWHPPLNAFPKNVWELVAWIRYSPQGWSLDDEDIKKAHDIISEYESLVDFPKIKKFNLDPDRYIYDWPNTFKKELKIGNPLPRFFNLKMIYQAKMNKNGIEQLNKAPSFLGVKEYVNDEGTKQQIAVIVRKRVDNKLQVSHIELNFAFSKKWVAELRNEHDVSDFKVIRCANLVSMRRAVFHLDEVLKDRRVLIPSMYSVLLKDLRLFNFMYTLPKPRNPEEQLILKEYMDTGGNFVHALAVAVSCADGPKRKFLVLKKRLNYW
ncbi:MAG: hypothetical protein NUK62_08240 [Tenericutes bacterium]|nr:hypothetical protein [Mycoplasmatota bacterium]